MSALDPPPSVRSVVLIWIVVVPAVIGLLIAFVVIRAWHWPEPSDRHAWSPSLALQEAQRDLRGGRTAEAAQLLAALANNGDPDAQYRLGQLTEKGIGTKRDVDKAIALYKQAADHNVVGAGVRLGEIYLRGDLVLPDGVLAQAYLERAAYQGSPSAAMLMGQLYSGATGRSPDLVDAYAWSEVAVIEGSRFASSERDASLNALDAEGQQAGIARAKEILAAIRQRRRPQ